jgi:hypothetical protein
MTMPSNVTYRTLEQGNEYVWPFLDFADSGGLVGKEFRIARNIMPGHIAYAKEIVLPLNYAMNRTYQTFFPFFEGNNPTLLRNHLLVIGNTQTYFESNEFMENRNGEDYIGLGFYADSMLDGKKGTKIEQGLHLRLSYNYDYPSKKIFEHEFTHAGIGILCTLGIAPYRYNDYNRVMHELFAQTIEDNKDTSPYPDEDYNIAQDILIGLNSIHDYKHLPKDKKLRFLLTFQTHNLLEDIIEFKRERD